MLRVKNLSKSMPGKLLFDDVSFKISENQKVGFVGPNGAGKSTLLKIIAGLEDADNGSVDTAGEIVGYLPQKIDAHLNTMIYEYLIKYLKNDWEDYKLKVVLARVGLGKVDQSLKIAQLSGGQKMKLGLARLLLLDPTFLLLDEPTNNLDLTSIIWLENFVKNFEGKVFIVSHDRTFLDNCVNKIIELDALSHHIEEYGGNYSYYVEEKKRRQANLMTSYKLQQQKEQKMKDWIREKQEQLKYHPNNKVARQLQSMKTRLDREVHQQKIEQPRDYKSFKINHLANSLDKKKFIFVIKDFKIDNLLSCEELFVFAHDRINLVGKNGSGKSSFLKSILGINNNYTGQIDLNQHIKIAYFSQEHEILNQDHTILDNFLDQTPITSEAQSRSILGKYLFSGDKIKAKISQLSEGEKARLILAILITQKNDFLILDEPTNHLDLASYDVFEEALNNYEGGFIVVSHDRSFLKNININRKLIIKNQIIFEE